MTRHRELYRGLLTIAALLALGAPIADASAVDAPVTVNIDPRVEYRNARGERVYARYGRLSDDTLHFVKLRLPGGKEYTLPLALSASGARYTDEREIVWWEHQGKARVEARNSEGTWVVRYEGLMPTTSRR